MPECITIRFTATFECSHVRSRPTATDRSSATGDRRSFELGLHPWTQILLGFFVKYDQVQPSILKRSSSVCMRCGHSARELLCRRRLVVRSTAKRHPTNQPTSTRTKIRWCLIVCVPLEVASRGFGEDGASTEQQELQPEQQQQRLAAARAAAGTARLRRVLAGHESRRGGGVGGRVGAGSRPHPPVRGAPGRTTTTRQG